jgi:hypothetical protein
MTNFCASLPVLDTFEILRAVIMKISFFWNVMPLV